MSHILSDLSDATLIKLVECWFQWRAGAEYPVRKSIEPIELGSALPNVWLCQKDEESGAFRYRLVGEAVNSLYGHGIRGRTPNDFLSEETADNVRRRLDNCLESGLIVHSIAPQTLKQRQHVLIERLFLPVTGDSGKLDMILGCTKITDTVTEASRHSVPSQETAYSNTGERLKVSNAKLTMFSRDINHLGDF